MQISDKKVEQLSSQCEVVLDYAEVLSKKEIKEIVTKYFPNTFVRDGFIYGRYDKTDFSIFIKNISYLGNPHPIFKKRIQISSEFKRIYQENSNRNIKTLLLGIYKYKDTLLFCDFDTSTYVKNNLHNSSAHVVINDLRNGMEKGFFQKRDLRGNKIVVFNKENINDFYKYKFEVTQIESKFEIVNTFDDFFNSIPKKWNGIDCYKEMIDDNYNNKFQSEWTGYYLEFLMSKYIDKHHLYDVVRYEQNKFKNGIDLDLYFSKISSYGDLKAHSTHSKAVLGNDKSTIDKLMENGNIYYIVCNHDTQMDKDNNYVVTNFWNSVQNKTDLMSYANKMKYSATLKSYYILEINKYNSKYLDVYKQGKNSDGKDRNPKISISAKNFDNFLIHAVEFD